MFKKMLSLLLAVMLVVSLAAVGVVNTGAAEVPVASTGDLDPATLYFDSSTTGWDMGTKGKISFHIFGGDFGTEENSTTGLAWGTKKALGTAVADSNGVFSFKPSAKGLTLNEGVQYKIIFGFSKNGTGAIDGGQTYDLLFTTDCLGHIAYCDGTEYENPVDSSKKTLAAFWHDMDASEYGPVLQISSIGNVVGTCPEAGRTPESIFNDFLTVVDSVTEVTTYANALHFVVEHGTKTEQKMIDDIGTDLGLTKQQVFDAFYNNNIETAWDYTVSTLPAGQSGHTHIPGDPVIENVTPATCTVQGTYDVVTYCTVCKSEISRETKYYEGGHSILYIPEVKSTYDAPGVKAHYQCTVCDKLFADEAGNVEVTDDDLHIPLVEMKIGDINKDYEITVMDATFIQFYLSYQRSLNGGGYEPVEPGSKDFTVADVDGDRRISIFDALRIQRYIAKMCKLDGSPYDD